ncbi:hypothetical protein BC332_28029 [Capsicum chinense]|nr:hypothetical protein BC332_28029 [Capsicum chinense]
MVEDVKYQFFPRDKVSFSKLMASLRQEFSIEKQLYRLRGNPQDIGIEKQSDIVVEDMQPLESIILGREHDLTLIIYKPLPTSTIETNEVADMQMSLINTIKGLSTCAGQPWHMVNEGQLTHECMTEYEMVNRYQVYTGNMNVKLNKIKEKYYLELDMNW